MCLGRYDRYGTPTVNGVLYPLSMQGIQEEIPWGWDGVMVRWFSNHSKGSGFLKGGGGRGYGEGGGILANVGM